MQSQVFTVLSKVFSRLLSTELLEIFSCEARSRNPSVAYTLHSVPPAWNQKTHPNDTDTCTSARQLCCQSKPVSSFPSSSPLFSVICCFYKRAGLWARAALTHMNLNTCQSYFQMKHRASHSCFHRRFWKAMVLSRANTRSNQKDIL